MVRRDTGSYRARVIRGSGTKRDIYNNCERLLVFMAVYGPRGTYDHDMHTRLRGVHTVSG